MRRFSCIFFAVATWGSVASASSFPRVEQDLQIYSDMVAEKRSAFQKIPANSQSKDWLKQKLTHMVDLDQYTRRYLDVPFEHKYTPEEKNFFNAKFMNLWVNIDETNTSDLRVLLKSVVWFRISEFGAKADKDAWILVQHADRDPAFQQQVLAVLAGLYPKQETDPAGYAYLYDRVAASWNDPSLRRHQRYGTQGFCTGPGRWEPIPIEEPSQLDARRKDVGLEPEADYITSFKDICHGNEARF